MRSDSDIKKDVEDELRWDPDIDSTDIAVSVNKGVVALTGFIHHYNDKFEAEVAAKRVAGVVGVANDIEVRLPAIDQRPDPEIARDAVDAIKRQLPTVEGNLKVVVKSGWVTLEGETDWNYQRERAEAIVRWLKGVKGVTNLIRLKPQAAPTEIKRKIEAAFRRNAEVDANHITVETNSHSIVLRGTVRSWAERQEAERVAWSAPGITKVENQIVVSP
jgi:osmotically-inducible protein OsmY